MVAKINFTANFADTLRGSFLPLYNSVLTKPEKRVKILNEDFKQEESMRRIVSVDIILCMTAAIFFAVLPVSAAEPTLTTDKTVYNFGEPIMVSAWSENKSGADWIGIAVKGHTEWGTLRWEYLADVDGAFDITMASHEGQKAEFDPYRNFPAGEYTVYFIPDDKNLRGNEGIALGSVDITIVGDASVSPVKVKAPTAAEYTPDNDKNGLLGGALELTLPEEHFSDDIYAFWGNDGGKLEGYTRLARFKVNSRDTTKLTCELPRGTMIPASATKILLYGFNDKYGLSKDFLEVSLPENGGYKLPTGAPIAEFQVISDAHISSEARANSFARALADIAKNSPGSMGIFTVGDMVDDGKTTAQWEQLWRIYDEAEGVPEMYLSFGNHETYGYASYDSALGRFLYNLRLPAGYPMPETQYYDLWIGGFHFIFLGDSELPKAETRATIGNEQYAWLSEKLAENADGRPIFLFMHQPLKDTVSGSSVEEGWWGIEDGEILSELLREYPQTVMFNGHTHWTMDSENCMYGGDGAAAIFNTASVGYLWSSYDVPTGELLEGSQGYYVEIYEDRILVKGRDFTTGEWVSAAQFVLEDIALPEDLEDGVPERPTEADPTETDSKKTDTDIPKTTETAVPEETGGCGASITLGGIATIVLTVCASLALGRKKEY